MPVASRALYDQKNEDTAQRQRKRSTWKEITKALEIWTLQTLLNVSILLGMLALGFALAQGYYRGLEKHLSLRVSMELWRLATVVFADVVLVLVVLVGLLVLNPDIMVGHQDSGAVLPDRDDPLQRGPRPAALPRGTRGGLEELPAGAVPDGAASIINILGFTFVAEAATEEYSLAQSRLVWDYLRDHLQSNAVPFGMELGAGDVLRLFPDPRGGTGLGFPSAVKQIKTRERPIVHGMAVGSHRRELSGMRYLCGSLPAWRYRHDAGNGLSATRALRLRGLHALR